LTTIVPKGRGPFDSFLAGAIDALAYDGLTKVIDWRLEKQLWYCERFNGLGYANKGLPSPYVWGGTSIQRPGKYVADGVWDPNAHDGQPGCAPLLKTIAELDPTVQFVRETAEGAPEPEDKPTDAPVRNPRVEAALAHLRPILEELATVPQVPAVQSSDPTVSDVLKVLLERLDKGPPQVKDTKPALEKLDDATQGYKTIVGVAGMLFTWFGGQYAGLGPEVQNLLVAGFGVITAVGVSAKLDRGIAAVKALVALQAKLQQMPKS
jgi:hypothetical protein